MPNPFALPEGPLGRFAGWLMARVNTAQQHEVLGLLDVPSAGRVLEVGYGPGVLAALVLASDPAVTYAAVDPSETMRDQATRRNQAAVDAGRARFLAGSAADLPFADGEFDLAVAVNNVRLWPDLAAAAAQVRRVLKPGGRLVVTWHGPTSPSPVQRRLAMTEDQLASVIAGLQTAFDSVERRDLPSSVALVAT